MYFIQPQKPKHKNGPNQTNFSPHTHKQQQQRKALIWQLLGEASLWFLVKTQKQQTPQCAYSNSH